MMSYLYPKRQPMPSRELLKLFPSWKPYWDISLDGFKRNIIRSGMIQQYNNLRIIERNEGRKAVKQYLAIQAQA